MKNKMFNTFIGLIIFSMAFFAMSSNVGISINESSLTLENAIALNQAQAEDPEEIDCFGSIGTCVEIYDASGTLVGTVKGTKI